MGILNQLADRVRANPVRWALISLLSGLMLGGMCGGWYCGRSGDEPAPVVEEKIVTQEVIQEVPITVEVPVIEEVEVTVEIPVIEEVVVTEEVIQEVPVTVEVPTVVEVPVPITIEVPVYVPTPIPPEPTAGIPATLDPPAGENVTLTLSPDSGPPGTRVQLIWSGQPPFHQGAAYFDGQFLKNYRSCGLGLCGPPYVGVMKIPDERDATPGPYLVGVGDGTQLITAVWMMTH